ncbi:MAG: inositol monophosphatase family protein [Verrucomicrobia bacterium]|nr:inositol monophosphatase family protein [Verrucomicrobiota bacterium]MDA1088249.1 inositol monophosphatase family protein [Verrucomicrobiota bacterium]
MPDIDAIFQTALRALTAACETTARVQAGFDAREALTKHDRSPVTIADYASQVILSKHLWDVFPDYGMISEENADELRKPENSAQLSSVCEQVRVHLPDISEAEICELLTRGGRGDHGLDWTLDPIDGTKGFMRGDQYAVALALLCDGKVIAGFMGCPRYSVMGGLTPSIFYAAQGEGAWHRILDTPDPDQEIKVDDTAVLTQARIIRGVEAAHANLGIVDVMKARLGMQAEDVRMDGQGKYAAVATGDATAYLRVPQLDSTRKECVWDHAAGVIIVEEAGGKVTDVEGSPLDFTVGDTLAENRGIIATNGAIHEEVLGVVSAIEAEAV